MNWLKWFKKEEIPLPSPSVSPAPIPDFIWITDDKGLNASPSNNGGVSFMKTAIHKDEIVKRIAQARKAKDLKWEVSNRGFKTYTAKTASRYIQVFMLDHTTCNLLISTAAVYEPISKPMTHQHIYHNETIKNTDVGTVLAYAYRLHQNEILKELNEVD